MEVKMKSCRVQTVGLNSFIILYISMNKEFQGIHEEAAMCVFQYFIEDLAKAAFTHRMSTVKDYDTQMKRIISMNCPIVNYLLTTYTIDDETAP